MKIHPVYPEDQQSKNSGSRPELHFAIKRKLGGNFLVIFKLKALLEGDITALIFT